MMSADQDLRWRAERRVRAKLVFRTHLFVYALVNGGLLLQNLTTSPNNLWCLWTVLGWGVGLLAHGFVVYGAGTVDRGRMVEAELAQMRRGAGAPPR